MVKVYRSDGSLYEPTQDHKQAEAFAVVTALGEAMFGAVKAVFGDDFPEAEARMMVDAPVDLSSGGYLIGAKIERHGRIYEQAKYVGEPVGIEEISVAFVRGICQDIEREEEGRTAIRRRHEEAAANEAKAAEEAKPKT